ncbi:Carbohydrate esterase 4 protein [Tulasnella sp. UAMH 9824]|nr:Carbohydrate esterase 4 protein [Tulasnella sp. UAMH 9824]
MFSKSRLFAVSLLATIASALPAKFSKPELSVDEAFSLFKRAPASVYYNCTVPNTVAITFDDGPYTWTNEIVDTLARYNAKATFFFNGNNYECIYSPENEARLKYAYAAGHQMASHTWAHLDWTTLSNQRLLSEMTLLDDALIKILGVKPAFVRPPFGKFNEASRDVAAYNGESIVIWDFDSGDSQGASAQRMETDYQNLAAQKPGNILTLNHETYEATAHRILPFALSALQAQGYSFVTVAECLASNPYQIVTTPQTRDVGYLDVLNNSLPFSPTISLGPAHYDSTMNLPSTDI